jgi:hypothetical protein
MSDSTNQQTNRPEPDVKLRHEFVGMMFAVTIGEVGIQVASLIHAGHWLHYLPAYSHLFLSTVFIATSWVGWSLSLAPGARRDVRRIFELPFVVLLIDVSLVISYFILVRSVDFPAERVEPRIAPESTVALWVAVIFGLYLLWDVVTKIFAYKKDINDPWRKNYGSRMLPTLICFALAIVLWSLLKNADVPHFLTANIALLSLVLLFRALKDLVSAWPKSSGKSKTGPIVWTIVCVVGIAVGTVWTSCWPLPGSLANHIQAPISKENGDANKASVHSEPNPATNKAHEPPSR